MIDMLAMVLREASRKGYLATGVKDGRGRESLWTDVTDVKEKRKGESGEEGDERRRGSLE